MRSEIVLTLNDRTCTDLTSESPRSAGLKKLLGQICILNFPRDGRIAPITDLASLHQIRIGAGVIDPDFRGNLSVVQNFLSTSRGIKVQ